MGGHYLNVEECKQKLAGLFMGSPVMSAADQMISIIINPLSGVGDRRPEVRPV